MGQHMTIEFHGGKRIVASYDGFEIATDQSVDGGGAASAPEPFDLFLASLGTCAAHYVGSFCANRDIPRDGIRLEQTWSRDEKRRLTHIHLEITVPDDFPDKYRRALVRAAGQCSVKKVLEDPPAIETTVRSA